MNQYTNDELQLLAETYDLTVEELQELFDQGYTEEDLNNMSMSSDQEEESPMEEEPSVDSVNEEPDNAVEYEARMGLSLNDLLLKSVQDYTKTYNPGGKVMCPPGQIYDQTSGTCIDDPTQMGRWDASNDAYAQEADQRMATMASNALYAQEADKRAMELRNAQTPVLPTLDTKPVPPIVGGYNPFRVPAQLPLQYPEEPEFTPDFSFENQDFLDNITTIPEPGNPDDPSSQEIEDVLGPSGAGSISQQAVLSQQGTATAKENAVASTIEETDPYKGKDMKPFTDIVGKTRDEIRREYIANKVVSGLKEGVKKGAKYLFGSEQGQGMLMGLGNMATDAMAANAMNQQLAGLKQARVFNINPDFFSGANPNIASSSNYDMSAAIYAEAGAVVNTKDISGKGEVPIEAEGGEFYFDPNSMATIPIQGPSHEKGGVKFNAAEGSFIFSDSEKISGKMVNEIVGAKKLSDKKEYTISDVIRALPEFFDTKHEAEQLTKTTNDKIRNTSLKYNMQKKADNLSLLLSYQQKKNGNHGEEDEQQMMQEEQPMARRGMMVFDPGGAITAAQIAKIDKLVETGVLAKAEADLFKKATVNPDGTFSIPYSKDLEKFDPKVIGQVSGALDGKLKVSNIPKSVTTMFGKPVTSVSEEKREYKDPVSNKVFNSKEEYQKFREANPEMYKAAETDRRFYSSPTEQFGGTAKPYTEKEAVDILKKYNKTKNLRTFVINENLIKKDGKLNPDAMDEVVKAFNSLATTNQKTGKPTFAYTENGEQKFVIQSSGSTKGFFGGLTPELTAEYYAYKTYGGTPMFEQIKDNPQAMKDLWAKEVVGLTDDELASKAWKDNKYFTSKEWVTKSEKIVPDALRPGRGNDTQFGWDHVDYQFGKKLNMDPTENIIPGYNEYGIAPEKGDTGGGGGGTGGGGGEDGGGGELYKEKLTPYDYARYFSDVATIVPEEYLQQATPRYKPLNLLTARDQINQAASTAAASNLSGTGVESIDAARQAAMYSGLLEQAGKATENVQNANRGIIDDYFQYNNAQFLNAQQANERAKADFVQRSMQNQQAAQETRRQAQEDFAEKARDVSQFNAGLRFNEGIYSPQYSTFVDENGLIPVIGRDGTEYKFNPATMMFGNLPAYAQSKVETEKDKKEKDKNRKGGKIKSTKRKLIK